MRACGPMAPAVRIVAVERLASRAIIHNRTGCYWTGCGDEIGGGEDGQDRQRIAPRLPVFRLARPG